MLLRVALVPIVTPGELPHAYVPPPLAVRVVLCPLQIVVVPVMLAVAACDVFSVTDAVELQPPEVTVTV